MMQLIRQNLVKKRVFLLFLFSFSVLQLQANVSSISKKVPNAFVAPSITTASATSIGATQALLGGTVVSDGTFISDRGIVWSITANPMVSNSKITIGSGEGTFSQMIGLPSNRTIYYRAYAITENGTFYGDEMSFETLVATAPGNALNFAGTQNVTLNTAASTATNFSGSNSFTIETWINPSTFSSDNPVIFGHKNNALAGYSFIILSASGRLYLEGTSSGKASTLGIKINQWNHIAVTFEPVSGNTGTATFYINGQDAGGAGTLNISPIQLTSTIGSLSNGVSRFRGKIDEFRIWDTVRTKEQIQASMHSEMEAPIPGLLVYYTFDQGIAGGSNTGLTTLYDHSQNQYNAILNGFTLAGTTFNWLQSYAMVQPTALPATNVTTTGFKANWSAPATGAFENYLLDVSTNPQFTSFLSGYNAKEIASATTFEILTGLTAGAYYYRLRTKSGTEISTFSTTVSTAILAPDANQILYVNQNATGNGVGNSWENAVPKLADAFIAAQNLNTATPGTVNEIWVAQGTYYPLYSPQYNAFGVDAGRDNTFLLPHNVKVYGGFSGNETIIEGRNFDAHPTILTGDVDQNDEVENGISTTLNGNNVYHVVMALGTIQEATLDGFTITGGNAITNNVYVINSISTSRSAGGGLYVEGMKLDLNNVSVAGNRGFTGVGLFLRNSIEVSLANSIVKQNIGSSQGGGLSTISGSQSQSPNSNLSIENVVFENNVADAAGGLNLAGRWRFSMKNVTIRNNIAATYAGGISIRMLGESTLENVSIIGNSAGTDGGGIFNREGRPILKNVVISGNTANKGGGMYNMFGAFPKLYNVTIAGNFAANKGGGIYNYATANPGSLLMINTIVFGNGNPEFNLVLDVEIDFNAIDPNSSNNIIDGPVPAGNIAGLPQGLTANSLFTYYQPATAGNPTVVGDYSLRECSFAIDAGTEDISSLGLPEIDFAGNPRVAFDRIDIGAYEALENDCTIIWLASDEWSNQTGPTLDDDVIIEGDLEINTDLAAQNLTVAATGSLRIENGGSLTLNGNIVNSATATDFVVANGGNLLQLADVVNVGSITVYQNSTPMIRNDMTLWSSPVQGQQIKAFSPETLDNRFWSYDEPSSLYSVLPNVNVPFEAAQGIAIRVRNTLPSGQSEVVEGKFEGIPFTGTISVPVTANGDGYNLVGNPYASNIDAQSFLTSNLNVEALYFWTHEFAVGSANFGNNYATFSTAGSNLGNIDFISKGQGFFVKTNTAANVEFNNSMRVANAAEFYRGQNNTERSRLWVSVSNQEAKLGQILVAYMSGATNGFDNQIDAKLLENGTVEFYNVLESKKYAIQGRALPFETSDIVSIGLKLTEGGNFSINLENVDGIFAEENLTVYLKDKQKNFLHNLSESPYAFESESGEFNDRFQIVSEREEILGSDDLIANSVQIYTQNDQIVVSSKSEKVLSVELFDMVGRNIFKNEKINSNHYEFKSTSKGILIIKVQMPNGEIVTKKIIKK